MALPSSYFTSTKNLGGILDQIQKGQVPPKFTYDHLKQLGFPSSNDRPIIPVLKVLGFLDGNGVPQDRYRRFKNPAEARRVMADGIKEAYADVFAIDERANKLPADQIKGIFARLSEKGEGVTDKMAMTFRALVEHADFSARTDEGSAEDQDGDGDTQAQDAVVSQRESVAGVLTLRHDVHVHLPTSEDIKVYDAIFRSLRDNLLA
jgi:uncharacterized protein DUF5343